MSAAQSITRAAFFQRLAGLSAVLLVDPRVIAASSGSGPLKHPNPRAGVTADKVLKVEALGENARKSVVEAFDAARQYPQTFDGLACGCGCHGEASHQHRSLLVCYETEQPTGCQSCQMEATFVGQMVKNGKTLAEIRLAVDKKFG
jgi:hypothetical protein